MGKNLSNKYGQKRFNSPKKPTTDAIKTASKRVIQKQQKQQVIGNKIANKKRVFQQKRKAAKNDDANSEIEVDRASPKEVPKKRYTFPEESQKIIDELRLTSKERYISRKKRQQIIDELRLVLQYNDGTSKNSKFVRQCIKSFF